MLRAEKIKFMDDELKGLWPDWKPTEAETRVWFGVLEKYDYEVARNAAQKYFLDTGGNFRRPKPGGFIAKASVISQGKTGKKNESDVPQTNVFISCIEAPEHHPNMTDHKIPVFPEDLSRIGDPDYVRSCAHGLAEKFRQLYEGHWIVVVGKTENHDSGLRGKAARDKAFRDILDGPCTKTRLWLQKYLKRVKTAQIETCGPVHISEAIAETIPF